MTGQFMNMTDVLNMGESSNTKKKMNKYNISDDDSDEDEEMEDEEDSNDDDDDDDVFCNNSEYRNKKKGKKLFESEITTTKSKKNSNGNDSSYNITPSLHENKKNNASKRKKTTTNKENISEKKMKLSDNKKELNGKKFPPIKMKLDENYNNKKKIQEENSNFKMDKKFYNQILFKIKKNEEYSTEIKERLLKDINTNINDLCDVDYETYLQLNFSHQKNGQMICAQRPPPLKHSYVIKILETVIKYFSSNDMEEDQSDAKSFLNELEQITKHDYEKIYYILLLYFYSYEAYVSNNLTKNIFPKPEDPLIDFSLDIIPIHLISLNKRSNQKFNMKNDDKRFILLKNLVYIVVKQMNNFDREETINDNLLNYLISCDIKKSLNFHDNRVSKNKYLAGLIFCISFLCDIVIFGIRRLSIKKKIANK